MEVSEDLEETNNKYQSLINEKSNMDRNVKKMLVEYEELKAGNDKKT